MGQFYLLQKGTLSKDHTLFKDREAQKTTPYSVAHTFGLKMKCLNQKP